MIDKQPFVGSDLKDADALLTGGEVCAALHGRGAGQVRQRGDQNQGEPRCLRDGFASSRSFIRVLHDSTSC
jgi:hypothetical protein